MRRKYKMTGFARFLIFLIMFTPLAYMGAAYYNGEDGIEKIKSFIENITSSDEPSEKTVEAEVPREIKSEEKVESETPAETKDVIIKNQEAEIKELEERLNKLEKQVEGMQE